MHRFITALIFTLSLLPLLGFAQQPSQTQQLQSSVEALLQALDSAAQKNSTISQQLTDTLQHDAKQLIEQSQQLIANNDTKQANQLLNRALIKIKIAINALKGTPLQPVFKGDTQNTEQQQTSAFVIQKRNDQLTKVKSSVDSLMQALLRIAEEKQQQAMADDIQLQVDSWNQQSDQLAEQGQLIEAQQLLDQSMVAIKTAIGSLRNSETLVRSLNFATKQEEYVYELDRFETYQMLLNQLVLPKPALTQQQKEQISQLTEKANAQQAQAKQQASEGMYQEAITSIEMAGRTLLKAIRSGGVYLPG